MAREVIVEREFTPDQAGQRVGWVAVNLNEREDAENAIYLNATIATIGQDGARVSYIQDGEHKLTTDGSVTGFEAVTNIGGVILQESGIKDHSQVRVISSGRQRFFPDPISPNDLINRGSGERHLAGVPKFWVDTPAELLGRIKAGIERYTDGRAYPYLYYLFNHGAAHADLRPKDVRTAAGEEWLLPDPSMSNHTHKEHSYANQIVSLLGAVYDEDKKMKDRLTAFTDVPPAKLPDVFTGSRLQVAKKEAKVIEVANDMQVSGAVYLPIGFRPEGRTWPYMDPTVSDEDRAFGQELAGLKRRSIQPADHELNKEIRELELRIDWAKKGAAVLSMLGYAETKPVSTTVTA